MFHIDVEPYQCRTFRGIKKKSGEGLQVRPFQYPPIKTIYINQESLFV